MACSSNRFVHPTPVRKPSKTYSTTRRKMAVSAECPCHKQLKERGLRGCTADRVFWPHCHLERHHPSSGTPTSCPRCDRSSGNACQLRKELHEVRLGKGASTHALLSSRATGIAIGLRVGTDTSVRRPPRPRRFCPLPLSRRRVLRRASRLSSLSSPSSATRVRLEDEDDACDVEDAQSCARREYAKSLRALIIAALP
jgi:hypothetical protein